MALLPWLALAGEPELRPATVAKPSIHWRTDYDAARREAAEKKLPLFIFTTFRTCFWAHKMEAETLSDSKIVALLSERFIPVKVFAEQNPTVIESFHVQSFPTTIVSSWHGQGVQMIEGYADVERLMEELDVPLGMFPKGREHDFGAVFRGSRGTQLKYGFPVVNTTRAPITITDVRWSVCAAPYLPAVSVTRTVLQPNETGELQVTLDTGRLFSSRTACVWLVVKTAEGQHTFRFTIMARPEE